MFLWLTGAQDGCTRCRKATSRPLPCRNPHDGHPGCGVSTEFLANPKCSGSVMLKLQEIYTPSSMMTALLTRESKMDSFAASKVPSVAPEICFMIRHLYQKRTGAGCSASLRLNCFERHAFSN